MVFVKIQRRELAALDKMPTECATVLPLGRDAHVRSDEYYGTLRGYKRAWFYVPALGAVACSHRPFAAELIRRSMGR